MEVGGGEGRGEGWGEPCPFGQSFGMGVGRGGGDTASAAAFRPGFMCACFGRWGGGRWVTPLPHIGDRPRDGVGPLPGPPPPRS